MIAALPWYASGFSRSAKTLDLMILASQMVHQAEFDMEQRHDQVVFLYSL